MAPPDPHPKDPASALAGRGPARRGSACGTDASGRKSAAPDRSVAAASEVPGVPSGGSASAERVGRGGASCVALRVPVGPGRRCRTRVDRRVAIVPAKHRFVGTGPGALRPARTAEPGRAIVRCARLASEVEDATA